MENKNSIILCYIGGILMIFNPIGLMIFDFTIYDLTTLEQDYDSTEMINQLLRSVSLLISGFLVIIGGIAVIYGAFIIAKNRFRLGKKFILVAVLINLIVSLAFISLFSVLGVILAGIANRLLYESYKKPR